MTRTLSAARHRRSRRITQPIRIQVVERVRDPAVTRLGFTCFRLLPTEDGLEPIELMHSTNTMFAFVRGA